MRELHAIVGTLDDMGADFISAWNQGAAEADQQVTESVCFESAKELYRVLSPKRIDLLKRLRALQALSVFALAKALGRNYKNVHGDVKILEQYGLIVREGDKITAPYDVIHADFDLRQALPFTHKSRHRTLVHGSDQGPAHR